MLETVVISDGGHSRLSCHVKYVCAGDYVQYALGLISDYLPTDLSKQLSTSLRLAFFQLSVCAALSLHLTAAVSSLMLFPASVFNCCFCHCINQLHVSLTSDYVAELCTETLSSIHILNHIDCVHILRKIFV